MYEIKFAENLRALRKLRHMSQKQLSELVGVDQRTVSAWETSKCEPSFSALAKLCDIFDETMDGILG